MEAGNQLSISFFFFISFSFISHFYLAIFVARAVLKTKENTGLGSSFETKEHLQRCGVLKEDLNKTTLGTRHDQQK